MKQKPAIGHWWTTQEWGMDARSGAVAYLRERQRRETDRVGKDTHVWDWRVVYIDRLIKCADVSHDGTAQNQLGARAAVRKFIRALPDKPKDKLR